MATKSTKLPTHLFVTSKLSRESVGDRHPVTGYTYEDHVFGFLHPHEPSLRGDDSRKHTQIQWAYTGEVYKIGSQYWHRGVDRTWDPGRTQVTHHPFDQPIDPTYAPKIWVNEPLAGFTIIDTVNRYRGNKLFKVLDPRGVEFEITVASLFDIIQNGDISNGVIHTPCAWKANKKLVIAV